MLSFRGSKVKNIVHKEEPVLIPIIIFDTMKNYESRTDNVIQSPIQNEQNHQPQLKIAYLWYYKFHEFIISFCFEVNTLNDCVYQKLV